MRISSTLSSPRLHSSVRRVVGARAVFATSRYALHQFTICHQSRDAADTAAGRTHLHSFMGTRRPHIYFTCRSVRSLCGFRLLVPGV